MKVNLYTDGSSKGNPGPGGYGTLISYTDSSNVTHTKTFSAGYKNTTNNRMELMGAIRGLTELVQPCEVDLYSDSQYVIKAFTEKWIQNWVKNDWKKSDGSVVKNQDLWKKLIELVEKHKVTFHWVKGHNGHPENEMCDKMAVQAASNPMLEDKVL